MADDSKPPTSLADYVHQRTMRAIRAGQAKPPPGCVFERDVATAVEASLREHIAERLDQREGYLTAEHHIARCIASGLYRVVGREPCAALLRRLSAELLKQADDVQRNG